MMKMSGIKVIGWVVLAWLAGFGLCLAKAEKGEKLIAYSDTAYSITGDIVFFHDHIIFQNGKSIKIVFVKRTSGFITEGGKHKDADLYRVVDHANPVLLYGNTMCGSTLVTYIAIYNSEKIADDEVNPRAIIIYTGIKMPASYEDSSPCGGFRYVDGK